ncbi:F-box/kelch-repeat protein At3g06240-like [Cornus florida]|uniref:F-box/kelch-repeat protein At3g06240-like n=1 Tax=Cornus florida TaxID=4283 RepID=UPI00289C2E60|nr:F-box/kelch-repeat protein At3g06240-like [Cornus florida]
MEEKAYESLPYDLIVDILSRLPVKSLVRFKSVSKCWLNLFTDPYFVKMHLNRSHKRKKLVSWCTCSPIFFTNIPLICSLDNDQPKAVHIESLLPFRTESIRFYGSCDGLILFLNFPSRRLCLLNPSTRELNKLPNSPFQNRLTVSYGFGYDASADDYKVVEVSFTGFQSNASVYALKTNCWRKVHSFPYGIRIYNGGTLFNGVLHWLACGKMPRIVAFHLADDKFQDIPFPCFETPRPSPRVIGVVRGSLCIKVTSDELWVMNEYGKRESWIKVNFRQKETAATFRPSTKPLMVQNYNLEKNTYSYIQIPCTHDCHGKLTDHHEAENCLESIVSPSHVITHD